MPNILLFMSDQHNPRVLGCAGDPWVRTPHLDRLAAGGVLFRNTYCAGPLCVPSRMTFLTGQHCSDIQVWTNSCTLAPEVPTFAHPLSLAGCETILCGRMHFVGPDQRRGFERRLVGDVSGAVSVHWPAMFEGQIPLETTGQDWRAMSAVGAGRSTYMAYDDAVTERACRLLSERGREDPARPFCMVVGTLLPHNPLICPRDLFEEYMDRLPVLPNECPADLHPAMRHGREFRGVERITPEQARRGRAAYYGLVTYADQRLGLVLDALAATRFARDTVVAYTSDHGDMAGQQGLWWKDSFYDGAVGVPMIWSWPGHFRAGQIERAVTSLLDVAPTLTDLAGADPLPGVHGHSLVSLLDGSEPSAHCHPGVAYAEICPIGMRPARMLRTGPWKLNLYHGYEHPQLFHLENDPEEMHDLGRSPEFAGIRKELMARVQNDWSGEWVEQTVRRRAAGQAMVRRWHQQGSAGESEVWQVPVGCNAREA